MFGIYLTIVVLEFYLLYLCMIMNLFNDAKVMRHAFLILAHNEFQILKILLSRHSCISPWQYNHVIQRS